MVAAVAVFMEYTFHPDTDTVHDPDVDLVARCKAGDSDAFREIYHAHRLIVYGVVSRMINNSADRDEVVQDAFLQVFKSINSFKGTSKLSTWIHRVAFNVTLQYIRKKGRRVRLHFNEDLTHNVASHLDEGPDTPEQEAMLGDRQAAVQRVLDTLAPKKRLVLILADFQGMSSQEIAEVVGAPALTVRTRLFYARKTFYERLAKEPAFEGSLFEGESR